MIAAILLLVALVAASPAAEICKVLSSGIVEVDTEMLMDYIDDASSRISSDVCGGITDLEEKEKCITEVTEHLKEPEELMELLERICDIIVGADVDEEEIENEVAPVPTEEEEEEDEDEKEDEDHDEDEDDNDDDDDDDEDKDEEARKAEEKARRKAEKKAKKEAKKAEKKRLKEEKKRQKKHEEEKEEEKK